MLIIKMPLTKILRDGYTDLEVVYDPLDSETEYLDQFKVQHSKE